MDRITSKFAMILLFVVVLSTLVTTLAFYQIEQSSYYPEPEAAKSSSQGKVRIYIEGSDKYQAPPTPSVPDNGQVRINIIDNE